MRFKIYLGLILAFTVGFGGYGYFSAVPPAKETARTISRIEISPAKYDFGRISYGESVSHNFEVKNTGRKKLRLEEPATSCSCTTASLRNNELKPGETTKLVVTYDSGRMPADHSLGYQERFVFVESNAPNNPQVTVKFYGNVFQ